MTPSLAKRAVFWKSAYGNYSVALIIECAKGEALIERKTVEVDGVEIEIDNDVKCYFEEAERDRCLNALKEAKRLLTMVDDKPIVTWGSVLREDGSCVGRFVLTPRRTILEDEKKELVTLLERAGWVVVAEEVASDNDDATNSG